MKKLLLLVSFMLVFSHLSGMDTKDDNYMKHFLGGVAIPEAAWQVSSLFFDRTETKEWTDSEGWHSEIKRVENIYHFPYKMLISLGVTTAFSYATHQEGEGLDAISNGCKIWFTYKILSFQIKRGKW